MSLVKRKMAEIWIITKIIFLLTFLQNGLITVAADDILGCGGFVKSHVALDFAKIEIGLYTKGGSLRDKTECAPTNGYYFLPLYEKGDYILKVHPPPGWSFEPSEVTLVVDGVTDACSTGEDINFAFNGFGITGRVITAGQEIGPKDVAVQLVNDDGDVRNTVTTVGGDFHFTPVIPGKYTVKASHPRWKLEPSVAKVQVKEGNTVLPVGVLSVKGYDVRGSVTSFGAPLSGFYVLLYTNDPKQRLRVEGCKTALLQGVPDSPICYSVTDSNGEFSFGLVPAGKYKLLALAHPPGQTGVSYNIKPESVQFNVQHDSLYIKNAFEVNGFTVVGSVTKTVGGVGLSGVRVLLGELPFATTDSTGRYTLPDLKPGVYTLSFQHEQCEVDPLELMVRSGGASPPVSAVSRWRVCGSVRPARRLLLPPASPLATQPSGDWCTFLPPGVYTASIELSDQDIKDGLQFFPESHKIVVKDSPVDDVSFSQLKGTVSGSVQCLRPKDCERLAVQLRPLDNAGRVLGPMQTTQLKADGTYSFPDIAAGTVEVSVGGDRLCWQRPAVRVAVRAATAQAPPLVQTGYVWRARAMHPLQVEWVGPSGVSGRSEVPAGSSQQCAPQAGRYSLTPRSCHKYQPATVVIHTAETEQDTPPTAYFVEVAHEVTIWVESPVAVDDLTLDVGGRVSDPLKPEYDKESGLYIYKHTVYMANGEEATVRPQSSSLVFNPASAAVSGRDACRPRALTLPARRARSPRGRTAPPVRAALSLRHGDTVITQIANEDGSYDFGPLDAEIEYTITAELESYVFSEPDKNGVITARKLAEIIVELVDDVDGSPLQGGLVSVSGGSYRRTLGVGGVGGARFAGLSPERYYVKPHMKEFRFQPPHATIQLPDGETRTIQLRGVRVAWSCLGVVQGLSGAPWAHAALVAVPRATSATGTTRCVPEEATAETSGAFRIRGLLPGCVYNIQLKEPQPIPELAGLRIVKAPPSVEVKDKDIEDVVVVGVQRSWLCDVTVRVRGSTSALRTVRVSVSPARVPGAPPSPPGPAAVFPPTTTPPAAGLFYPLPRLPKNASYVIEIESTLSPVVYSYEDIVIHFDTDADYKHFDVEFNPKLKLLEQELHQTSLLVIPLFGLLLMVYLYQDMIIQKVVELFNRLSRAGTRGRTPREPKGRGAELLDKASIDMIVSSVNAAGKRTSKKKN